MRYRVLIVEDDEVIAENIAAKLEKWDLKTKRVEDFQCVYEEFLAFDPALVILDIALPYCDGYKWCEDIRKVSKVPILYISSMSDNMNIIMAMNMGGDDFLVKPFDNDVLVAKVTALLRRTYDWQVKQDHLEVKGAILRLGDQVLLYDKKEIELTKNEFRILKTLFEDKNLVVTREKLMQKLWETDEFIDDNTLTVNIARLRRKLEDIGLQDFIETKKGQGYILKDV